MSTPTDPTPAPPPAGGPPAPGPGIPEPAPPPTPTDPPAPPVDPAPDDVPLGPAGEKALDIWKHRAKEAERLAGDQAARLKEFEDAQKSEAEKLAERATAAEQRAASATKAAVAAKVEALAGRTVGARAAFADPEDAISALDLAKYSDEAGAIDAEAIEADLAELLGRKPHWAAGAAAPKTPKPDRGQGPRPGGNPGGVDEQIAEAQAKGEWRTALRLQNSKLGQTTTT